jgi:hypothetical protein
MVSPLDRLSSSVEPQAQSYSNFFLSDYCLMEHVDLWQMITLSLSTGYLTFDIYICYAKM